ncbi:MAG: polysaccharide biosynthesis C-terminal domain-containing protein [Bacteriovoracaceae bacterium]|nr:polysaccharide biosynthesis C-terminal domain-containing protein [Bacteriovoracaceae bacterium]
MKSRLDNFALNFSSSGFKFIISTVLGFVLTPIIIKNVGIEAFGLFKTLQDYIAYLLLLEFGLYGALLATFNKIVNNQDKNEKLQVFWLSISNYIKVALGSLFVGLLILPFITTLIKNDHLLEHSFYYSYIALLLGFITLPFLSFKAYLDASQKGYLVSIGLTIQIISNAILVVLSLYFELGVPGLCTALLISNFLSSLWYFYASDIKLKDIISQRRVLISNNSLVKQISKMRKAMFSTDLSGKVCLFTDNIIIGYLLGAKFVTPFFVTQKLSLIIQTQLQYLSNSSWAGLGEIYHKESPEALGQSIIDLTKWIGILGVVALVPLVSYNRFFIELWTGPATYAGFYVTLVACLNAFFLGILTLWGWCFTATSKIHLVVPLSWTQTICNLTLNIVLTYKYGIVGPILATLICYVFINMSWLGLLTKREFKTSLVKLHLSWILPLVYGILFYLTWNHFRGPIEKLGWIRLILEMSVEGILLLGFSFILVMNSQERRASYNRLMKLLKRN